MPVKAFEQAKVRLAPALGATDRAELARWMAERVLAAASPLPVAVACDNQNVANWAITLGARVVWTPERGLNGAVQEGVSQLAADGVSRVIVVHADLPLAEDLQQLCGSQGVTLISDRHHDGTNVACVPSDAGFRFSYGPGSLMRHIDETKRLGLPLEVLRRPQLEWDVDVPADLAFAPKRTGWPIHK